LWPFGIFVVLWYIFPVLVRRAKKIWQPWFQLGSYTYIHAIVNIFLREKKNLGVPQISKNSYPF
jgi:hypothetical protein